MLNWFRISGCRPGTYALPLTARRLEEMALAEFGDPPSPPAPRHDRAAVVLQSLKEASDKRSL